MRIILCVLFVCIVASSLCQAQFAWVDDINDEHTDEEIANAIYKAEGGDKATYLYGIRSVKYDTPEEARRVCLNTIRNQRRRHANHDCGLTYLECLANRYCPVGASNDPKGLNKNWLKNVRYFLNKNKE